jgi:hypothetical protein
MYRSTVAALCSSGTLEKSLSETGIVWLLGHSPSDTAISMLLALLPPWPTACVKSPRAVDGEALHSC